MTSHALSKLLRESTLSTVYFNATASYTKFSIYFYYGGFLKNKAIGELFNAKPSCMYTRINLNFVSTGVALTAFGTLDRFDARVRCAKTQEGPRTAPRSRLATSRDPR